MPTVDVVNLSNQKVGEITLAESVFGTTVNEALLWESVRHYMAGVRSGTVKTKRRWEVSGSGKKLWRQKGTGRARIGSIRSPLWRHGATVHGPIPRDYSYHLPKKMLLGALRSALTAKLRDGELKVVDAFSIAEGKTRLVASALKQLEATRTVLLVEAGENPNLMKGSRNIPGVTLSSSKEVTTYDLLRHQKVVLTQAAAMKLSEGLA
ncbi:MAG: 50S ribosomal protein L4 [Candidatus Solibacter usitatus]|nr:50S ribosomal protein L4 [Candidatus Solibacter usitatus]